MRAFLATVAVLPLIAGIVLGLAQEAGSQEPIIALVPQPRTVQPGDGWLPVTGGFRVEWLDCRNALLERAVSRFQDDVARRTRLDVGRTSAARLRIDCRREDQGYLRK